MGTRPSSRFARPAVQQLLGALDLHGPPGQRHGPQHGHPAAQAPLVFLYLTLLLLLAPGALLPAHHPAHLHRELRAAPLLACAVL